MASAVVHFSRLYVQENAVKTHSFLFMFVMFAIERRDSCSLGG